MRLRVTRPGFALGIAALAAGDAEVPHLPSIEKWRKGHRSEPYDPNALATRQEMRSFVCGQCHVEYYCANKMTLTFPWGNGLTADDLESFWDETTFPDGSAFYDYAHGETGGEGLQGPAPRVRALESGHPCAQRRQLRRLPHVLRAPGRDLGSEIDFVLSKQIDPNLSVLIEGAYYDGCGGQPNISHAWLQTEFKF